FSLHDVAVAQKTPNAFWIHPVEREYDNGARNLTREKSNHYKSENGFTDLPVSADLFMMSTLLSQIRGIDGWLSDREAELLAAITLKACNPLPGPHNIVEIGSFQGKSTVVLGTVAKAFFHEAR